MGNCYITPGIQTGTLYLFFKAQMPPSLIKHSQHTCYELSPLLPSQFSSVAQSCPTLCKPIMPGFPVHHQLLELTQTSAFKYMIFLLPEVCHSALYHKLLEIGCFSPETYKFLEFRSHVRIVSLM